MCESLSTGHCSGSADGCQEQAAGLAAAMKIGAAHVCGLLHAVTQCLVELQLLHMWHTQSAALHGAWHSRHSCSSTICAPTGKATKPHPAYFDVLVCTDLALLAHHVLLREGGWARESKCTQAQPAACEPHNTLIHSLAENDHR